MLGRRQELQTLGRWRLSRVALLMAGLAVVLAGCASETPDASATDEGTGDTTSPTEDSMDNGDGGTEAEEDVETVRYAGTTSFNAVPLFTGVERGTFLKHGVDLQIDLKGQGREALTAMHSGAAELFGAAASSMPGYDEGLHWVNVSPIMGNPIEERFDSNFSIWTVEGSGIESVEDLEGASVGVLIASTMDTYLDAALEDHGVDPSSVNKVNVPLADARAAIEGGDADAVSVVAPWGAAIEASPEAVLLSRGGGYLQYSTALGANIDFLDSRPDLVERVLIGFAEESQWVRNNLDEAAEIATRWIPGLDKDQASRALENLSFDPRPGDPILQGWEDEMERMVQAGDMSSVVPRDELWDLSILESVLQDHPEYFEDVEPLS